MISQYLLFLLSGFSFAYTDGSLDGKEKGESPSTISTRSHIRTTSKGGGSYALTSTISTHSQTLIYLFSVLYLRRLPSIFNLGASSQQLY